MNNNNAVLDFKQFAELAESSDWSFDLKFSSFELIIMRRSIVQFWMKTSKCQLNYGGYARIWSNVSETETC